MDRRAPVAATSARWARFLLSGVLAVALTGGGLYLARSELFPGPASSRSTASPRATAAGCRAAAASGCPGNPAYLAIAATPAVVTVPPRQPKTSSSASAASRSPSPTAPAASASPSVSAGGSAATQVLALINQARTAAGLPALTITSGLETSSSQHNLRMADGCGLLHQCAGEPALGARETAAGVGWTSAGENIGEGGPVAGTAAAIAQMAVGLTQSMLNEQPPDDGHRLNILSSSFNHIGIAVYRDSSGTVWLTQDFSN
jgi:uncharacterized protein YkwD